MYIIYKITNKINNKLYVGYTHNLNKRWAAHVCQMNSMNSKHLYCAMRCYGLDNFIIEIIEDNIATQIDALEKETNYILKLNSLSKNGFGYNIDLYSGRSITDNKVICTKCNQLKDISEYNKNKNSSLGISSSCRICHKQAHYLRKEIANKKAKIWKENNKDKIKKYYKNYCKTDKYKQIKKISDLKYRSKTKHKIAELDKLKRLNTKNSTKGIYKEIVLLYNNNEQKYCSSCKQLLSILLFNKSGDRIKTTCKNCRSLQYYNQKVNTPYSLGAIE